MRQSTGKQREFCEIISNNLLVDQVYEMILACPGIVRETNAGQFVNLYCRHEGRLLPRPISVCEIDRENGYLHLVYAILGDGTREFATYKAGETISVMGPFGNGFDCNSIADEHLIVGGGVGTPPMVELCKQLKGKKTIILGFRDNPYLLERFERHGDVYVATDNGSVGFKGNVVELMEQKGLKGRIYACGPTPMLQGIQAYAGLYGLDATLSLEERMGCGFGGCVGCVTKTIADTQAGYTYKKVCKDGPVFNAKEVLFS